jgi:hypothetical protein
MQEKKTTGSFFWGTILLFSVTSAIAATSPLQYRIFSNWIVEPAGIIEYRSDTRTIRNIVLCDTIDNDTIRDITENSNAFWVLAASGIYQIDRATTTVEKLPGGKMGGLRSRLAVDDDYVWTGINDTLWRFDKLGREWFPYPMKSGDNLLCGIYSNGTNVYCPQSSSIKIFSIQDEKWLEFPYKKGMTISPQAEFFYNKNTLVLVDGPAIYRYLTNSQSWDIVNALAPVVDISIQDEAIYYLTASGMFKYSTTTMLTRPLEIPEVAGTRCFSPLQGMSGGDSVFCVSNKGVTKYDVTSKTVEDFKCPQGTCNDAAEKILLLSPGMVILYPKAIVTFNPSILVWETINLAGRSKKADVFSWDDDNGIKLRYGGGYESQLRGRFLQNFKIDSATADGVMAYSLPMPLAENMTLHTTLGQGRYMDLFFNNFEPGEFPRKGVFYRGAASDVVETARVGTSEFNNAQSKTIPQMQFEGASAVLQSASSLSTRDRRIVKAQAGGGCVTTRTEYEILPYSENGIYWVSTASSAGSGKKIVPGSLKLYIDGEEIDSTNFSFSAFTGMLTFTRQGLLDRTSIISISYQIRTVPKLTGAEIAEESVEFVPKNNLGSIGYASVTVSPNDWISPQAGFYSLNTDITHKLFNAGLPAEIRSSSLFLKINPEITIDAQTNKKAVGLGVQSRVGDKMSLLFNGLLPDSGFVTTNNLDRGYGFLKHDADLKLSYDVKKELPISYYQRDILSAHGTERRYELTAGSHFQGLPFCDISLSRNTIDADRCDTVPNTDTLSPAADTVIFDTLNRKKDKFRVRLYETSSPILESLLHVKRLNYELSYTGFSSQKERQAGTGYGDIFFGSGSISPTNRLTLTAQGTYLKNPAGSQFGSEYTPLFMLQTIDAPPGFDIYADDKIDFKNVPDSGSSTSRTMRSVTLTIKPGAWFPIMSWIQPIVGINQTITCAFSSMDPGLDVLLWADNDVVGSVTTRSLGANIFPANDITFRNENKWTNPDLFSTFNDLKWWFSDKRLWQTRWEYDRDRPAFLLGGLRDYHRGYTRFTNNWTPWFLTRTGVSASYTKTHLGSTATAGPDLTFSIMTQKLHFIRSLLNNHVVNVWWVKRNGVVQSTPEISYASDLRLVIVPNILIKANNSLAFERGAFRKYSGTFSACVVF